jgi:fluoride exporter
MAKSMALIFIGGGLGAVLRYATVQLATALAVPKSFPWAILAANTLGSLVLGYLAALPILSSRQHPLWLFLATGVLGGYTTFSTFSNDTWEMLCRGQVLAALLNSVVSVLLGLGAAAVGWKLANFTA